MIVRKKLSVFAIDETEQKLPCKLNLQVWDSDHFSPDDFLGKLKASSLHFFFLLFQQ